MGHFSMEIAAPSGSNLSGTQQASGHSHGHDPADHSHQVAFVSHHTTEALQKLDVIRFVEITDLVKLDLGSGLERPPKRNVRI